MKKNISVSFWAEKIDVIHKIINRICRTMQMKVQTGIHIVIKNIICDKKYFDEIYDDIKKIPESNGEKYYTSYNAPVAIVADEFLFNSFKSVANFKYVTPENYRLVCDEVEILLIVTAWRGLHNEWRFMGTEKSAANLAVHELIKYYKEKGKKIVFYSKEDPPHYKHFLPIAKQCDIIFTSAIEKIEEYKRDCSNDKVFLMKFGINPVYHNPIGCKIKKIKNTVIFSGSWVKKYPERIREQQIVFDGVLKAGKDLKIIDRNFELNNWGFLFPLRYYKYISPAISHENLQKVHKLYDWAINMNSVQDSRTMFANRVYELQAEGNLIISNDSKGVREQFREVEIVDCEEDVVKVLSTDNEEMIYERQIAGIRRVMTGETTFDRVGEILVKCGYQGNQPIRKVAVLANGMTKEIQSSFDEQTYLHKELFEMGEEIHGKLEDYDIIAIWDNDSSYGPFYLEDMINAFKYTNCDYITKDSFVREGILEPGVEHNYVKSIKNIYATIFWRASVEYSKILQFVCETGEIYLENGYSTDHFNYSKK